VPRFYFDHNATTPVAQPILDVLLAVLVDDFGNASSIHYDGQRARHRLEQARRQVARLLGTDPKEIVFTSGGTEADNLAIFGVLRQPDRRGNHVVTSAIEHPAVLNACAELEREGVEVTYVRPDARGVVEPDAVQRALRADTVLVSIMHVNNELGTVQPLAEIAEIARSAGVLMHSDGVQAAGRLAVNMHDLGVDLYSISAHKMYAPKGAGALFVRNEVALQPIMYGGRHERQRRAGTENVPGCVALGGACEMAGQELALEAARISALRDRFEEGVRERLGRGVEVNGAGAPRIANTTNLQLQGIGGDAIVIALDLKGFSISTGSACSSGAVEPSHVLTAIGLRPDQARSSVRISLGRMNTVEQVDALIDAFAEVAAHLRRLSPVSVAYV
jgi:cysteine desulfurase